MLRPKTSSLQISSFGSNADAPGKRISGISISSVPGFTLRLLLAGFWGRFGQARCRARSFAAAEGLSEEGEHSLLPTNSNDGSSSASSNISSYVVAP